MANRNDDAETKKIEEANFTLFRDCLSAPLIEKSRSKPTSKQKKVRSNRSGRKIAIKPVVVAEDKVEDDANELAEFVDYLASEIFTSLPPDLRTLTYSLYINTPSLQKPYSIHLPDSTLTHLIDTTSPTVIDTLSTYLSDPTLETTNILVRALNSYSEAILTAPPPPTLTKDKAQGCELCEREWIPLTYHHLIPREMHQKVLKRGWHTEDQLGNVAWLCRACHSFVHRVATNEELARDWYTVERLEEREDVIAFANWIGGVRWKAR